MKILIINTGVGNIKAIKNIFDHLGYDSLVTESTKDIMKFDCLFLPGVGSYDAAIHELKKNNFYDYLKDDIFIKDKLIIGICLGMQLLFNKSEEGNAEGLSLIPGNVKKFNDPNLRVPHMGWNNISVKKDYKELDKKKFYFAHSYYVECDSSYVVAYCDYSLNFPAIVKKNNIIGIQFHPEKSHQNGMLLLNKILSEI